MFLYLPSTEAYLVEDRNNILLHRPEVIEFIKTHINAHRECIQCILQKSLSVNCSEYTNDEKIRKSFPFYVEHNPKLPSLSQTYASMNSNKKIYHLNIVNEKFFPPIIFCLTYLETLYVKSSSFVIFDHQLPSEIQYLAHSLNFLEIYDTKIIHLSNEIGKLTKLIRLTLSNTSLMSLPDEIGDLSSLNFLLLPDNKLIFLPKTIKNLGSLKKLILTNNPLLRSIEPINSLPFLQILRLDYCSIKHIPLNLSQLMYLSMSYNDLRILTGIKTLGYGTKHKKNFYFDNNSIQSIPSEIQHVRNLSSLNLNHNQLNNLPLSMFNIKTLANLYIKNHKFSDDDLKQIVQIFKCTNPKLNLVY